MENVETKIGYKLSRGKLHSDKIISTKGVTYAVRVIIILNIVHLVYSIIFILSLYYSTSEI